MCPKAETPPIATNLYCAGAYFNHSCAPNVTHYFANGRLVCRAHQVIEAGEPVSISYGSSFHSELLPQRKSYLWNSFHFRCRCPACVGKWAPLKQLLVANGAALKFKVFDEKYPLTRESVSTSEDEDTSVEEKTKRRATRSRLLTSRCGWNHMLTIFFGEKKKKTYFTVLRGSQTTSTTWPLCQ